MKEIKAFLRPERVDPVVHALEDAGLHAITVIPVQAIGILADPSSSHLSPEFLCRYSNVYKLELVCREPDLPRALHLVVQLGRTGRPGDGAVYVSNVERFVKIRTGEEGADTLDAMK